MIISQINYNIYQKSMSNAKYNSPHASSDEYFIHQQPESYINNPITYREIGRYFNITPIVSFGSVGNGGATLKKLAAYGVPDMYTGRMMLDAKLLEKWQQNNLFSKPIKEIINHTKYYKKTLGDVERKVYNILEQEAAKTPKATLSIIIKRLQPQYEKQLLKLQQPIFEELIQTACTMPQDRFNAFMSLMDITNKKIERNPVILPFSQREFRYKLSRISNEIESRNNYKEVRAIKKLKRVAGFLFPSEAPTSCFVVKNTKLKKRTNNSSKNPELIKQNFYKLSKLKNILENSPLKDNKELVELFDDMSARIHGFPTIVPFKRKPFIHDLEKITDTLEDKKLANKMQQIAVKLPRAAEEVSAFIVKVADNTNYKIGFNLFDGSICSVDHLKPSKGGGAGTLWNYGLCSKSTNSEKSNMTFHKWIEKHPESRENIQKYIDRLIHLYKNGVFKHIDLKRSYIENFAYTINSLTQNHNPVVLDLTKLYGFEF